MNFIKIKFIKNYVSKNIDSLKKNFKVKSNDC